ncbi:succinate dehydrogenase assembly factor 2, mitochondrial-like [Neocloeon triangulifer]|uniref:succinate dehydrogenase assembly factor 2, mitochondrial-like n=1 Tax=Neocloeon triangulifer TaxID=2078957 RepID=UPI00286F78B5|nr:succinate dehydrogenase assembly factor 2, mitochondrial-like [Neocloeon triangulifer]
MALNGRILLTAARNFAKLQYRAPIRTIVSTTPRLTDMKEPDDIREPFIPPYQEKIDEPIKMKKARLLYQSRKRGMSENGLLLSTFAAKYLEQMDEKTLQDYDRLINLPSNDWDIFYWASGVKPTPAEFDNEIMNRLKEHVSNKDREARLHQPALY